MAIFHCPECGVIKRVPDKHIDKSVKCPSCAMPKKIRPENAEDAARLRAAKAAEEALGQTPQTTGQDLDHGPPEAQVVGQAPDHGQGAEEIHQKAPPHRPADDKRFALRQSEAVEAGPRLFAGNLVQNLLSGLVVGLVTFMVNVALAGLIFSQDIHSGFFPHLLAMAMFAAAVAGAVTALSSRAPFTAAAPESAGAVVLFLMVASMRRELDGFYSPASVYPTILAGMAVSAVVMGLVMCLAARMKTGRWLRFLPYQAVGGLMAGVGMLLILGAWRLSTATGPCLSDLTAHAATLAGWPALADCAPWLPSAAFALVLFLLVRREGNVAVLMALLAGASAATHFGLAHYGVDALAAAQSGWLLPAFETPALAETFTRLNWLRVEWGVIASHAGYMLALAGLVMATMMLKLTNMEIALSKTLDMDRECYALGFANVLGGMAGLPSGLSLSRSLGSWRMGAGGPLAALTASALLAASIPFLDRVVPLIPSFAPAGLLGFMGLSLLKRWLIDTRAEFTRTDDYSLLITVFAVSTALGLVAGMGVGLALGLVVIVSRYGSTDVVKHTLSGAHFHSNVDRAPAQLKLLKEEGSRIHIMRLQGFIFLGTTQSVTAKIQERIKDQGQGPLEFLILDFTRVSGLDSSVAISFTKLKQLARGMGFTLIFTNVLFEVEEQLEEGGYRLEDPEGGSRAFFNLDYATEWCENQLLDRAGLLTVERQPLALHLKSVFPKPKYIPGFMTLLTHKEYDEGETIIRQGAEPDGMFFLEHGMVNVQVELDGGKTVRLKKMGPGTVFGEMGLYTAGRRTASVIAAEECSVYMLTTEKFEMIQRQDPLLASAVHRFVVNLMAERVKDSNDKVFDLLR